ncbi:Uncharacterised protein g11155 [Pycnogonum litorale]
MQSCLLCYLTIVALLPVVVVSACIPKQCKWIKTKTFECDCDINGISYEQIVYPLSFDDCKDVTIQMVYTDMDEIAVKTTGKYFAFEIHYDDIQNLRVPLFPSHVTVISVALRSYNSSTFPLGLFENQKDNIRVVDFYTPYSYPYPSPILYGLTKMRQLKLAVTGLMEEPHYISFDKFSIKDTLVDVYMNMGAVNFISTGLANFNNLRSFELSSDWMNIKKLVSIIPTGLHSLKIVSMWSNSSSFEASMVEQILRRCPSLHRLDFYSSHLFHVETTDWSFVKNYALKEIDLRDNGLLYCTCGLTSLSKLVKVSIATDQDGDCKKPVNLPQENWPRC